MVFPYKWFINPFASAGDVTAIPNAPPLDGSISYQTGWGPDYQLDPATNPSALDVDRRTTNQLMLDVTTVLQYLQSGQVVAWIDATTNGGSAYSYAKGAIVLYTDGKLYQSLVVTNTITPGTDATKWALWGTLGLQAQAGNYGTDSGAANAYVITTTPAVPALDALHAGMPIRFIPAFANTGASTLNLSGLGAVAIVHTDGTALASGDIPTGGIVEVLYQPTINKFILNGITRTLPTYTFLTAGTGATYNTPAGARRLEIWAVGAGGGSAGSGTAIAGSGSNGGDTIFDGVHAAGAQGGTNTGNGGVGGTGGTGTAKIRYRGFPGMPSMNSSAGLGGAYQAYGMPGGGNILNGGGDTDNNAPANSGAGAGGTSIPAQANAQSGAAGGGGEVAYILRDSPASTYLYSIGAGGGPGTAGTNGSVGHTGGSGWIIVKEIYY